MGAERRKKPGRGLLIKIIGLFIVLAGMAAAISGYILWNRIYSPNIDTGPVDFTYFYIPAGSGISDVFDMLEQQNLLNCRSSLEWVAEKKNYRRNVKPGRYRLSNRLNNNDLVNMLRAGNQAPVSLVFIQQRSIEDLASVVSKQIEPDSSAIAGLAKRTEFTELLGFDTLTIPALFIPNTYEVYWSISAEDFYRRMHNEYERFWSSEREQKREYLGLDRVEVSTLASIVSEETVMTVEMPVIAGVYINRLKRGMRLQADPTIKFAIGDFTVNRILTRHLAFDSPYNTYIYPGLPPGPIVIPSIQAIDAVLNAEDHNYLYFCAREDFSGYHRFARTLSEHNRNARLYREALNRRGVFR